ncbi:MAG: DUF86 domain-containing protein [Deltaproteobacteria bacterium]|nr:DUF86 domain-containing protein [Deltaproteobacteria bacterium]
MKKDPRVYLAQILERVERILSFTGKGKGSFLTSPLIQDAVIRNFEVIGEAAKRVPNEFRETHPSIPWKGLTALRDVLIHQYEGVNPEEVWRIVEKELPALKTAISSLLPPLEQLEQELGGDDVH